MSRDVSALEALDSALAGALLLDVREDFEWADGHAPQALHMPMGQISARVDELPTDRTIVCVCHVGGRSATVADALSRAGWNAVNLAGGMQAWVAAGLPVVDESGS